MNIFTQNILKAIYRLPEIRPYCAVVYKSSISLETLYPNSSLKLTTPSQPTDPNGKFTGYIPIKELDITYSRSSGPGGQNVNKVNTKVEVRFHVDSATWLSGNTKSKLSNMMKNKLSKEGYLIMRSDLTRYQQLNLADCLEKIRNLIRDCEVEQTAPSEESQERARRRLERAAVERLAIKRQRSQTKTERQAPIVD